MRWVSVEEFVSAFDAHELMQLDAQAMILQWFVTDVAEVQQAVDSRVEKQSFVCVRKSEK